MIPDTLGRKRAAIFPVTAVGSSTTKATFNTIEMLLSRKLQKTFYEKKKRFYLCVSK